MKRARDIRDQLAGLLERVEIELTSCYVSNFVLCGEWNSSNYYEFSVKINIKQNYYSNTFKIIIIRMIVYFDQGSC